MQFFSRDQLLKTFHKVKTEYFNFLAFKDNILGIPEEDEQSRIKRWRKEQAARRKAYEQRMKERRLSCNPGHLGHHLPAEQGHPGDRAGDSRGGPDHDLGLGNAG